MKARRRALYYLDEISPNAGNAKRRRTGEIWEERWGSIMGTWKHQKPQTSYCAKIFSPSKKALLEEGKRLDLTREFKALWKVRAIPFSSTKMLARLANNESGLIRFYNTLYVYRILRISILLRKRPQMVLFNTCHSLRVNYTGCIKIIWYKSSEISYVIIIKMKMNY